MNEFIGSWKLLSMEERQPDGATTYPYGQHPVGMLVYDASGHMAVQIMRSDRPALSSRSWQEMTPEEIKSAVEGFTAFFGTYEVKESESIIIHHVEGHLFATSVGKKLKRSFEFAGDRLILRPSDNRQVVWERLK